MQIEYLHIDKIKSKQSIDDWLLGFPQFIRDDVQSYLQEKDQLRVLGGKLLLKNAIEALGKSISLDQLSFTEKGKPYFQNSDFKFNISHSGDIVILVSSEDQDCGIDIELHRPINWKALRGKFTDNEWNIILNAEDSQKQFFHFWSIKESIIKADGRGVGVLGKTEILSESKAICDGQEWFIQPFELMNGYSSCVTIGNKIINIVAPKLVDI